MWCFHLLDSQNQVRRRQAALAMVAVLAVLCVVAAPATADEVQATDRYYDGLLELKLFDLIEYELRTNPPADELAARLLRRRVRLVIADDPLTPPARRRAALAEANQILAALIREHGTDERALDWQLDLVHSLIYEMAEPHYSAILLHGGTPTDQAVLKTLMSRATETLIRLRGYLEAEYARLDEVSLAEYERLDDRGYVAQLEEAMPRVEYLLLWARFYAALGEPADGAAQRQGLTEVLATLRENRSLLADPHAVSHVQAQALLLCGMTCRRLADLDSAVRFLQDAGEVVRNLADPQERRDLGWVRLLADIERIRALRDFDEFAEARRAVNDLRLRLERSGARDFGHRLVLAILEATVEQARNRRGPAAIRETLADPLTDLAVKPLADLAGEQPAYRDEVYAALYQRIQDSPSPQALHPFQQCALIAGHIVEATRLRHGPTDTGLLQTADRRADEARAVGLLEQAITLAGGLLDRRRDITSTLYSEALYNRAVAQHLLGERLDAARDFNAVATEFPRFSRALPAATYAVEIAVQLNEEPALRIRPEIQDLLLQTLRTLVEGFPDSDAAGYWRFFLAQALEDLGEIDAAAAKYARVGPDHPHHLVARFRVVRCRVLSLAEYVNSQDAELATVKRRAGATRDTVEQFIDSARGLDNPTAERLVAEATVHLAESEILPGVDRPESAIARLEDFEQLHPEDRDLIGRVLRVRIVAFEATGRLQEARQAVPRYIASAPREAGATLQTLFDATRLEIEQYRQAGREDLAESKAKAALLFAEQIFAWANSPNSGARPADLHTLRVQLAEALLSAGQPIDALPLFRQAMEDDAATQTDGIAHHPRLVLGYARTLQELDRCDDALELFNRVYSEAAQDSAYRFPALLGDLQCRTALGEDGAGIVAVIRQQRFLNPEMGGPELKAKFADLQAENEARR